MQMVSQLRAKKINMEKLEDRIARRGTNKHLDHFDQMLDANAPEPDERQKAEFGIVTSQLLLAGWEPPASQFQCCLMFSLQEPEIYKQLVREIREGVQSYKDINFDAAKGLEFLHAALLETLRITVISSHSLPRSEWNAFFCFTTRSSKSCKPAIQSAPAPP